MTKANRGPGHGTFLVKQTKKSNGQVDFNEHGAAVNRVTPQPSGNGCISIQSLGCTIRKDVSKKFFRLRTGFNRIIEESDQADLKRKHNCV
jgi:hypothetical protein